MRAERVKRKRNRKDKNTKKGIFQAVEVGKSGRMRAVAGGRGELRMNGIT